MTKWCVSNFCRGRRLDSDVLSVSVKHRDIFTSSFHPSLHSGKVPDPLACVTISLCPGFQPSSPLLCLLNYGNFHQLRPYRQDQVFGWHICAISKLLPPNQWFWGLLLTCDALCVEVACSSWGCICSSLLPYYKDMLGRLTGHCGLPPVCRQIVVSMAMSDD